MKLMEMDQSILEILDKAEDNALMFGWNKAYNDALEEMRDFYAQRGNFCPSIPYEIKNALRKACDRGAWRRRMRYAEEPQGGETVPEKAPAERENRSKTCFLEPARMMNGGVMMFYCYETPPLDYWEGLYTVDEYCTVMRKQYADPRRGEDGHSIQDRILQIHGDLRDAQEAMHSWEGDYTAGPFVFLLPDPDCDCLRHGFIWKQRNNGTTFVASPFELPWLNQYLVPPHTAKAEPVEHAPKRTPIFQNKIDF